MLNLCSPQQFWKNASQVTKTERAAALKLTSRRIRPGLPGIRDLYRNYETAGINWQHIFTTMHTVPAGMTSTLQPLDVGVNCVLKAIYRKAWRRRRLFEPEKSVQWDGATELAIIISAWQKVSPHTVRSSFSKAIDNFPPTQSLSSLRMVESEKRAVLQLVDRLPVRPVRSLSIEVPSRSSSRISSIRSDPCVNDAILARSLVDNDDEFHLTYDEYNNRYFH